MLRLKCLMSGGKLQRQRNMLQQLVASVLYEACKILKNYYHGYTC
ncbi:MAG: hypothetical protein ACTS73_01920 [Arsenophonus sp. NEOnobi-MAG3]